MKKVILVKLGGSVITDKSSLKKANIETINQLAQEISGARKKTKDLIILGHGGGSFPHRSAAIYKTIEGVKNRSSLIGMAKVKYDASLLNMIIADALINAGVPVFTLAPSAFLASKKSQVSQIFVSSILNLLKFNMIPLVYGDVITDSAIGCTIYSTEQILRELATTLTTYKYQVKSIIQVGKTDGVLDEKGITINNINNQNAKEILNNIRGSEATDVTGGMLHKVNEALLLAQKDIPTLIISADKGNLEKAILGKKVPGTMITS